MVMADILMMQSYSMKHVLCMGYRERSNMRAVLYGIGQRYHDLYNDSDNLGVGLWANEIEIVGFADSSPNTWGNEVIYNGLRFKVKNIKDIPADAFEKILVVSKNYFGEISNILCQNGFKQEQILLIDDLFEARFERIHYISKSYLEKQWDMLDKARGSISSFLEREKYQKVAVYGTGMLSRRLVGDLRQSDLRLPYFIGEENEELCGSIPVFTDLHKLPPVDIIVVTAENEDYMVVERKLCQENDYEIISIQELIYRVLKNLRGE